MSRLYLKFSNDVALGNNIMESINGTKSGNINNPKNDSININMMVVTDLTFGHPCINNSKKFTKYIANAISMIFVFLRLEPCRGIERAQVPKTV